MVKRLMRSAVLWVAALFMLVFLPALATNVSFEPGDVFVSLETGPVQWRLPNGTLRAVLVPTVSGWGEGMAFDASGNLYVARWRADGMGTTGNAVEMYNVLGQSMGKVGRDFNCDPHTIVFDASGAGYVGQAGCRRSLMKFAPGEVFPREYHPAEENQGIFWMDLAPDGCTMFYTSYGVKVKRYDTCLDVQLPDFNLAPLPGTAHDLRVLADGGVLVSSGEVITRLAASGAVARVYAGPLESTLWAGLDLTADGAFWAVNYFSSTVYKFSLDTGAILAQFSTGTPTNTAVAVRVKR